jgi:hypothetical protein
MVAPQHEHRGKLGGLRKREIIRLLAAGEITRSEIARRYDVSPAAITQFAQRNEQEIAEVKADMDSEFAGILIARKEARLSAYQEIYEQATTPMPVHDVRTGKVMEIDGQPLMEVKGDLAAKVLKQAAEEMGQLPTRLQVAGGLDIVTNYKIEGVDPEAMK